MLIKIFNTHTILYITKLSARYCRRLLFLARPVHYLTHVYAQKHRSSQLRQNYKINETECRSCKSAVYSILYQMVDSCTVNPGLILISLDWHHNCSPAPEVPVCTSPRTGVHHVKRRREKH